MEPNIIIKTLLNI